MKNMKKWKIEGRIIVNIDFKKDLEAKTETAAIKKAEKIAMKEFGLSRKHVVETHYSKIRMKRKYG